eukprot:5417936-Karenia_brevis.AAC.1
MVAVRIKNKAIPWPNGAPPVYIPPPPPVCCVCNKLRDVQQCPLCERSVRQCCFPFTNVCLYHLERGIIYVSGPIRIPILPLN